MIKTYQISGKFVRMDSKLFSSNIAWYSGYEIIHKTFLQATQNYNRFRITDQMLRQQYMEFPGEDASKTGYRHRLHPYSHP